ncbi:hypothetical protein LSAT2_013329, partial [Lamellibrachia satsuma]
AARVFEPGFSRLRARRSKRYATAPHGPRLRYLAPHPRGNVTVRYNFREEFTIVVSGHLYATSRSRDCVDSLSMPEVLRSIRTTESFNVEVLPRKALWDIL